MDNQIFRKEMKRYGWLVTFTSQGFVLYKTFCCKPVKVRLDRIKKGYLIYFPTYIFISKVSSFAPPIENERRYCRNKALIRSIINSLRKCQMWQNIENKIFIVVNKYNLKSNKRLLQEELDELLRP